MKRLFCFFTLTLLILCGCENSNINESESGVLQEKESEYVTKEALSIEVTEKKKDERKNEEKSEKDAATECVTEAVRFENESEPTTESDEDETYYVEWETAVFDKKIALTFDDGPSIYTKEILDVLDMYNCKATFFVVGNRIEKYEDILKEIADRGHEIGCHTWSHKRLTDVSAEEKEIEINQTREKIFEVTGKECLIVRPPYGAWDEELKETGEKVGVSFVNWSIDTLDWKTRDAESVYNEIITSAADGKIILCHDLYESTVEAIKKAVPYLLSEGYEFESISAMFEDGMEAGKIYYKK